MIEQTGFAFFYAPVFHPAMARVKDVRKSMGTKTLFNLLGPLCNPASPHAQVVGVYDAGLCELFAQALRELGAERAMVVHADGLDELSVSGPTLVYELADKKITDYEVTPQALGMQTWPQEQLTGGDATDNAALLNKVLQGVPGACLDAIALNAAAAIKVAGKRATLESGLSLAYDTIFNGTAANKLKEIVDCSQQK